MANEAMQRLRAKYPQYSTIDDTTLARKVVDKYPQYKEAFAEYLGEQPKAQPEQLSWSDVPGRAVQNLIPSAGKMMGDIWGAVTNPQQTVKSLGNVLLGGTVPPDPLAPIQTTPSAGFNQFTQGIRDRYGSADALKNTLANDPVGAAADASVVLGGVGALKSVPGMAGKIGRVAEGLSIAADPIAGPLRIAGKVVPKGLPARMYDQALKQSKTVGMGERSANVAVGLREGIPATKRGLNQIRDRIDDVTSQIDAGISKAGTAGRSVDLIEVLRPVEELKKFWGQSAGGADYVKKIDEFINGELSTGSLAKYKNGQIPIEVAQQFKRNTQAIMRKAYGELSTLDKELKKSMAFGVKEEIAKQYPEISALNARDSELIRLESQIENAVKREMNAPHFNILDFARGGGIGAATGSELAGVITTVYSRVMRSPGFKSQIAILLNKARKGTSVPPFVSKTAVTSRATVPPKE